MTLLDERNQGRERFHPNPRGCTLSLVLHLVLIACIKMLSPVPHSETRFVVIRLPSSGRLSPQDPTNPQQGLHTYSTKNAKSKGKESERRRLLAPVKQAPRKPRPAQMTRTRILSHL